MKMALYSNGIFLGATKNDYTRKDGTPATYYNVSVKQGAEVGSLPCVKEIYDAYISGAVKGRACPACLPFTASRIPYNDAPGKGECISSPCPGYGIGE